MEEIINFEKELANIPFDQECSNKAKKKGFSDVAIAKLMEVYRERSL